MVLITIVTRAEVAVFEEAVASVEVAVMASEEAGDLAVVAAIAEAVVEEVVEEALASKVEQKRSLYLI